MKLYFFKSDNIKDGKQAIPVCSCNYLRALTACIRFFRHNNYKGMPELIMLNE